LTVPVIPGNFLIAVCYTIHFYDQQQFPARKVSDVLKNRPLPAKCKAFHTSCFEHIFPKTRLGFGNILTKFPGIGRKMFIVMMVIGGRWLYVMKLMKSTPWPPPAGETCVEFELCCIAEPGNMPHRSGSKK